MPIKITWFGHAAFLLEHQDTRILIDPFLSGNSLSPVTPEAVSANVIVVTHGHGDHVGDTVEIAKRTGAQVLSNFEIINWFSAQGVKAVHPLHIGGGFDFPWGRVKLTIAHHGSCLPDGSNGGNPAGVLLTLGGKTIYHAGDTGLFYDMKLIGEEGVDLAILPIGDNFTMGPADALRAVKLIRPQKVVPIHFNTFDIIRQDPVAWSERVRDETDTEVRVMTPGEPIDV